MCDMIDLSSIFLEHDSGWPTLRRKKDEGFRVFPFPATFGLAAPVLGWPVEFCGGRGFWSKLPYQATWDPAPGFDPKVARDPKKRRVDPKK